MAALQPASRSGEAVEIWRMVSFTYTYANTRTHARTHARACTGISVHIMQVFRLGFMVNARVDFS